MFNIIIRQDTCGLICFKLGMMLNTARVYSLNEHDVHSRSQGYGKARTCAIIVVVEWYSAIQSQVFMM